MKFSHLGGLILVTACGFGAGLWVLSFWKREPNESKTQLVPVTTTDFWNRSQRLYQEGKLDEAIVDLKELVKGDNQSSKAWGLLAEIYIKKNDQANAEIAYGEVIKITPKSPAALSNRGLLRLQLGRKTEGLKDLDTAVEVDPKAVEARMIRGVKRQEDGKLTEAIQDYDEALKIQPDLVEGFVARGLAKQYLGDLDGAEKDFRSAEKLNASRFDIQADLAILLKMKGDEKGSATALANAIKVAPNQEASLRANLEKVKPGKK